MIIVLESNREVPRDSSPQRSVSLRSPPQVLQKPGVTISFVIPSLMGLDKVLESRPTGYTHFSKALRAGLQSHLQPLILQRDLILATVLDPRIKLQVT